MDESIISKIWNVNPAVIMPAGIDWSKLFQKQNVAETSYDEIPLRVPDHITLKDIIRWSHLKKLKEYGTFYMVSSGNLEFSLLDERIKRWYEYKSR